MPAKKDGWERVYTSIPPGMRKMLKERALVDTVDESVVIRQALKKYLDYDPRIHEGGDVSEDDLAEE